MKNPGEIKIITRREHCIKPGILGKYSKIHYATLKLRNNFYVSNDWTPERLVEFFDGVLELPPFDSDGDSIKYVIKRGDDVLDDRITLDAAGIKEGDVLRIVPVINETGGELEIMETEDLAKPEIVSRPPDDILKPFNVTGNKEISIKEYLKNLVKEKPEEQKETGEKPEKQKRDG